MRAAASHLLDADRARGRVVQRGRLDDVAVVAAGPVDLRRVHGDAWADPLGVVAEEVQLEMPQLVAALDGDVDVAAHVDGGVLRHVARRSTP
jgi:hypothetical protein